MHRPTQPVPGVEAACAAARPARRGARLGLAGIAAAVACMPGPASAREELYRCAARDAFSMEAGKQQRGEAATALLAAIDPLLVDTQTGAVRFGGTHLHQWRIEQQGGVSSDFVARSASAADGLWLRVWERPASFVLVHNSTNVVTGLCELAD